MSVVIVLFNLKPGVSVEHYEHWAKSTDLPIVNDLPAVERFQILRSQGLLSGDGAAPYQYVEILHLTSVAALKQDMAATPVMADVARQFREFADAPVFIVSTPL